MQTGRCWPVCAVFVVANMQGFSITCWRLFTWGAQSLPCCGTVYLRMLWCIQVAEMRRWIKLISSLRLSQGNWLSCLHISEASSEFPSSLFIQDQLTLVYPTIFIHSFRAAHSFAVIIKPPSRSTNQTNPSRPNIQLRKCNSKSLLLYSPPWPLSRLLMSEQMGSDNSP